MKKRFLNRIQDKYLGKRFPENLIPKKLLKKSSQHLRGADRISISSGRFTNLSSPLKRGIKSIRETRSALNCSPLPQIETLEHGLLAPFFIEDNNLVMSSSKVWVQSKRQQNYPRVYNASGKPPCIFDASGKPPLEFNATSLLFADTRREKVVSLYSYSQLENELNRQQEKRSSALLLQLMERKKLRILYGNLSNRETNTLISKATKSRGRFGDILFQLLESRLDVVLCKIGFFPTIPFARQWIYHGKVVVNDKIISFANYLLQPGDVISITQAYRHIVKNYIEHRAGAFSICFSKDLKPQNQSKDETDHSTRTNLGLFPWFKNHMLLEGMMTYLSMIDVEAKSESKRWDCNAPSTGESRGVAWKTAINHEDIKERERLIGPRLTLMELLGNPAIIRAHCGKKGKFCLATWQYRKELVRNKLRLISPILSHVEVSYKLLKVIYLYPAQRATFPAIIDIERILKS